MDYETYCVSPEDFSNTQANDISMFVVLRYHVCVACSKPPVAQNFVYLLLLLLSSSSSSYTGADIEMADPSPINSYRTSKCIVALPLRFRWNMAVCSVNTQFVII
jgi:hypothetical protein